MVKAPHRISDRGAYFRRSVFAIYFTSLMQGALGLVFPASSVLLRERLQIGDTLYGALFLPGLSLALVTSLLGNVLLRRWSLKALFVFGLASQSLVLVLIGLSGLQHRALGLTLLFAAMVVSGPAGGVLGITLNTAAVGLFPRAHSRALTALHGVLGTGATLGPILVALFAGGGFWAGAPFSLAGVILWLAWFARSREITGLPEHLDEEHGRFHVPRRLWIRSSTALLYGMGEATFTSWAAVFLTENRGLPLKVGAGALSAFWLAMTVGRLGSSLMMRWTSPFRISLVLVAAMALSFVLVARCHGAFDSMWRFALAGISCSAVFPLLLSQASTEMPDRTPQVSAVVSAAALAGLAIGAFGVGPLRGRIGLERIYLLSGLGPVALGLLLWLLHFRSARGGAAEERPTRAVDSSPSCTRKSM